MAGTLTVVLVLQAERFLNIMNAPSDLLSVLIAVLLGFGVNVAAKEYALWADKRAGDKSGASDADRIAIAVQAAVRPIVTEVVMSALTTHFGQSQPSQPTNHQ